MLNPADQSSGTGDETDTPASVARVGEVDVIVDTEPSSGARNMAVDEALLETGLRTHRCVVRIYRWREPTVTLGYFQKEPFEMAEGLRQLPSVRRLSGGGAILHDQEVTYSCVIPASHPRANAPSELYQVVHRMLIELLKECGCPSTLRSEAPAGSAGTPGATSDPFLCFLRADPNDIVCPADPQQQPVAAQGKLCKIVGSAQRRRRGTILQHGSVLLSASPKLPDVPGIHQLCPRFNRSAFCGSLAPQISKSLGHKLRYRDLNLSEQRRVDEILAGTPK